MAVKNYGIHDKWTNLDKLNNVDIKSVDGVIESVKINGEEAGGGGGSSDFSTADVRLVCTVGEGITVEVYNFAYIGSRNSIRTNLQLNGGFDDTIPTVLYKSTAKAMFAGLGEENLNISVTGNATVDLFVDNAINITGDCTITISAGE